MFLSPFEARGSTYYLAANTSAPTGIQPLTSTGAGCVQMQFVNMSNNDVYISWGATAALAQANAVIPTAGVPSPNCMPLLARGGTIYGIPVGSYISGISATGLSPVMVTLGEGA